MFTEAFYSCAPNPRGVRAPLLLPGLAACPVFSKTFGYDCHLLSSLEDCVGISHDLTTSGLPSVEVAESMLFRTFCITTLASSPNSLVSLIIPILMFTRLSFPFSFLPTCWSDL